MSRRFTPIECVERVVQYDNGRDKAGYRAILHDDYQAFVHGQPTASNADDEADALDRWWSACSDVHLEILGMWEQDGVVTLRYRLAGTNDGEFFGRPASGRKFEVENCTLLEIVDGKVKRVWRYSDTLGLLTQLGLIPGANFE
jgi:predicted ester cyclase